MSIIRVSKELGSSNILKSNKQEQFIKPAQKLLETYEIRLKELNSNIAKQGVILGKAKKEALAVEDKFEPEFDSNFQVKFRTAGVEKGKYRDLCNARKFLKQDIEDLISFLVSKNAFIGVTKEDSPKRIYAIKIETPVHSLDIESLLEIYKYAKDIELREASIRTLINKLSSLNIDNYLNGIREDINKFIKENNKKK